MKSAHWEMPQMNREWILICGKFQLFIFNMHKNEEEKGKKQQEKRAHIVEFVWHSVDEIDK